MTDRMRLSEKLEAVLALLAQSVELRAEREPTAAGHYQREFEWSAASLLRDHGDELRQALRDGERYRWLRDCENGGDVSAGIVESERPQGDVGDNGWERVMWLGDDVLDAAIDAAMGHRGSEEGL